MDDILYLIFHLVRMNETKYFIFYVYIIFIYKCIHEYMFYLYMEREGAIDLSQREQITL